MMMWLLIIAGVIGAISWFYLRGADLRPYDQPVRAPFADRAQPSEGHQAVVQSLGGFSELVVGVPRHRRLQVMRDYMDSFGQDVQFDGDIIPYDDGMIRGEWLVARGADTARRMLYIHGGAWVMGSPHSHRAITARFATLIGGAVFSLDYRLMPEHSRRDGILDCRNAYRWILENAPGGVQSAAQVYVGGDSAGGNLCLALIAWVRDQGLRAPDAAIALSPATDATFSSPSLKTNLATDAMLGPQFGKLSRVPRLLLWWFSWFSNRMPPSDPLVSPVFGDLSGLPPVLLQVSEAEMLLDDSRRYVNKACAQGSPATLQSWTHMVHVWHIFESSLPEADEAFAQIQQFFQQQGSLPRSAPSS